MIFHSYPNVKIYQLPILLLIQSISLVYDSINVNAELRLELPNTEIFKSSN